MGSNKYAPVTLSHVFGQRLPAVAGQFPLRYYSYCAPVTTGAVCSLFFFAAQANDLLLNEEDLLICWQPQQNGARLSS